MQDLKNKVWSEKYRPTDLEQLVMAQQYKNFLNQVVEEPEKSPHFLFHSFSPGTGKTSVAYLLCKLIGSDKLVLNASSDRGIDIIREKVNDFTKTKSLNVGVKKAVILDEADGLTSIAQNSLRNLMEETVSNAFFILTANHIEKIIEPLASRCVPINFNQPPKDQIKQYLSKIVNEEKIEGIKIEYIIEKFYPDIRKMVLKLQSIKQGIKIDLLEQDQIFEDLLINIKEKNFDKIKQKVLSEEVNVKEFINFLFNQVNTLKISFTNIAKLCRILAEIEKYINFNINPKVIFLSYIEDLNKCLTINY